MEYCYSFRIRGLHYSTLSREDAIRFLKKNHVMPDITLIGGKHDEFRHNRNVRMIENSKKEKDVRRHRAIEDAILSGQQIIWK